MTELFFRISILLIALFQSVNAVSAKEHLPLCPEMRNQTDSKYPKYAANKNWTNCVGRTTWGLTGNSYYFGEFKNGQKSGLGEWYQGMWKQGGASYRGEFKFNKFHGKGTYTTKNITKSGLWGYGVFIGSISKKSISILDTAPTNENLTSNTISLLQTKFNKFPQRIRKLIQKNLKMLGLYAFSVDGLYGRGTRGALSGYSKKFLNNADLKKTENVDQLLTAVLNHKSVPKIKIVEFPEVKPSSEVGPQPDIETVEVTELKPIEPPEINLEKEFGLSFYGSFLHSEKIPNALFFFGDIAKSDSFEFRKALRNHEVDLIILSSPGGLVWEGLSIAGIIHDKKLDTYVPKNSLKQKGNCASACSFMFFAGVNRNVNGKLGVHQFYASDSTKKAEIGDSQQNAQFTVSEIIGFLNEFETPPWVFERMFQQSEMYYFKESELLQLETEATELQQATYGRAEAFISELRTAFEETKN